MTGLKYQLICFDWDGTLFDSTAVIVSCIQQAVVDLGGARPDAGAAAQVIGLSLGPALARVAPDIAPGRELALRNRYLYHWARHQDDVQLFEGVLPLLHALRRKGHDLAVATGKSRRGLDSALMRPELQGIFHASRTADETAGKPDPQMMQELMDELACTPEQTLLVGDTTHDLKMAVNAGVAGLAVTWGAHSAGQLQALHPVFLAHCVPELQSWLERHG